MVGWRYRIGVCKGYKLAAATLVARIPRFKKLGQFLFVEETKCLRYLFSQQNQLIRLPGCS